ncbi:MAG: AAA family ATPase [bacterium]
MFFKRLEISGFNSFATKTTVEFQPGVTIIVGPNGCGKSNLFDAVRWVLGEQSAKSLRGHRMCDIIFGGTASYKALGLAQVTLVLENGSGSLPVATSEISITRRLFSTGESEYQLNKVPCRLRDIHELLMGTGVGTIAYSMLEQGKVDQIINTKPIERRYLFEEAAGISKYKARKDEAVRKLERTEQDLLRLADHIATLRRQCNSLKRQASKAERYKALTAELSQIEKHFLVLRYRQMSTNLEAAEKEVRVFDDRLAELSAQLARLETRTAEQQIHADELSRELGALQQRNYELQHQLQEIEHKIELLRQKSEHADQRLQQLTQDQKNVAARLEEVAKEKAGLLVQRKEILETLQTTEQQAGKLKEDYEKAKAGLDARTLRLSELRAKLRGANRTAASRKRHPILHLSARADGRACGPASRRNQGTER